MTHCRLSPLQLARIVIASLTASIVASRDSESGSIEVGKSADFIVLDQDILNLADAGHGDDIAHTRVLKTWFAGKAVYVRSSP